MSTGQFTNKGREQDKPVILSYLPATLSTNIQVAQEDDNRDVQVRITKLNPEISISQEDDNRRIQVRTPKLNPEISISQEDDNRGVQVKHPQLGTNIQSVEDRELRKYVIPLDGKWMPSTDPTQIGKNFQTMTNLCYQNTYVESVLGMTLINSDYHHEYLEVLAAMQFNKEDEHHILIQIQDATNTTSQVWTFDKAPTTTGEYFDDIDNTWAGATGATPPTGWSVTTAGTFTRVAGSQGYGLEIKHNGTNNDPMIYKDFSVVIGRTYTIHSTSKNVTATHAHISLGTTANATAYADTTVTPTDYTLTNVSIVPTETPLRISIGASTSTAAQTIIIDSLVIESDHVVLWTDTDTDTGYFSEAPNSSVAYCNGTDTCLWSGREAFVSAFLTSTAEVTGHTVTNPKDYSEIINNDLQDGDNVVVLGGGIDAYTVLMIHANEADATAGTDIIDSETSAKEITAVGNAQVDTAQAKFGTGSVYFDGAGDYLTLADSDDWYFTDGPFTIDLWIRYNGGTLQNKGICGQYVDSNNYWGFALGGSSKYVFEIKSGGASKALYTFSNTTPSSGIWYHLCLIRNGTKVALYVDGIEAAPEAWSTTISTNEVPNLASVLSVGNCNFAGATEYYFKGWIDEFRISKGIARWTANFTPPAKAYMSSALTFLVGTTRPAQAFNFYLSNVNAASSSMSGKEWNGNSWSTLTLTDFTDTGASLAANGSIAFPSTIETSQLKYLEGYLLYWYQFTLSGGSAEIYKVTADMPFQPLLDIWDGVETPISAFYINDNGVYNDYSVNVYEDSYSAADTTSFVEIDSLVTAEDGLEIGFTKKQTALNISVVPGHKNTQAATATVSYWDGSAYVSTNFTSDGTSSGTVPLDRTGVIHWNHNSLANESKKVISGSYPLYFYKVTWSATLTEDVQLYYVSGIPAQNNISGYSYPLMAADRLMLLDNVNEYRNKILISGEQAPMVMNGTNHFEIYVGDNQPLTCGTGLFAQFASNLYNMVLLFKKMQTWIMTWAQTDSGTIWERYMVSASIGCPAPGTLKNASVSLDGSINQTRNIAIWQSHDGIYISDGRTPLLVSEDIEIVFDQTATTHINLAMIEKSQGFINYRKNRYHWLWASGSNVVLDKEYVLDLKRWKWYEIDRGTTQHLQCGCDVEDDYGNEYCYGFINTGYMLRLDNGTTFNGSDIVSTLQIGDQIFLENDFMTETRLEKLVLVTLARNTDTTITVTNYVNGATSGTDHTVTISEATHRFATTVTDIYSAASIFHSIKIAGTFNDETKGLIPLFLGAYFMPEREKLT